MSVTAYGLCGFALMFCITLFLVWGKMNPVVGLTIIPVIFGLAIGATPIELGAWALQYSSEKLQAMSAEAVRTADAKWNERDVQHGNLSAAIKAYDEAVVYLDTVNPKPAGYEELLAKRRKAQDELDRRYRDQRFLVDRAVNLGDWAAARRELRILCDMVPDERDPRHAEASAKLVDVENRQKKGGAR